MAENTTTLPQSVSRWQPGWLVGTLFRPRRTFTKIAEQPGAAWLTPMLILSVTALIYVFVRGFLQARAAAMGEIPLPPDWQWWTPEMQNQYMQAQSATQGPVFVYVIPAVTGLAGLWVGWALIGSLLHFAFTLFGGRGSAASALNVAGWAWLPFGVRDLLRVIYMLIAQRTIASAGLSGFITPGESGGLIFLGQLLALIDLFVIWHILLLVIGMRASDGLSTAKSIGGVLIVILLALIAQAGIGAGLSALSGLMISRPF
jgi:hypothetical protein